MAAQHETILFDVHDAKVYPMFSDNFASPAYGAGVDVYGIAAVSLDPNFVTNELKGDGGQVLAKKGRFDKMNVSATYGRLSGDVLDVILGTETTDESGTQARTRFINGTSMPYFKFACVIDDADNGIASVHLTLYKAQITGGSLLSQQTDAFGQPTFDLEAIGIDTDDSDEDWPISLMADLDFYTVQTALP